MVGPATPRPAASVRMTASGKTIAALNSLRFAPQTQLAAKDPDTAAESHDGLPFGKHCQDEEVKHAIVSLAPGCSCFFF